MFQFRSASLAIGISILGFLCNDTLADTVTLRNGRTVEGVIVDDTPPKPLIFQYVWDGIQKTVHVPREKISDYTKDDPLAGAVGQQADADLPEKDQHQAVSPPVDIDTTADLRPLLRSLLPKRVEGNREVVVVHLRGRFDEPNLHEVGNIITSGEFNVMLGLAQEREPEAIVLALDSGGGRVDVMDSIIEQLLEAQSGTNGERVVAWVELGGSAAALTAMSCKEIIMIPHGRMGSATMVFGDGTEVPEAKTAMEHKIAAMREARRRQVAVFTDRSESVQLAMEDPEQRLWHHPAHGFSITEQDSADGWKAYDTSTTAPLALAAHECVELGIAKGTATNIAELCDVLGVKQGVEIVDIDLGDAALQSLLLPARQKALKTQQFCEDGMQRLDKGLNRFFDNVQVARRANRGIMDRSGGYTKADLYGLQRAIRACRLPVIRGSLRTTLKEWDPSRLAQYETGLAEARRFLRRAEASTRSLPNSLPVGTIESDLLKSQSWAMSGPFRGYLLHMNMPRDESNDKS